MHQLISLQRSLIASNAALKLIFSKESAPYGASSFNHDYLWFLFFCVFEMFLHIKYAIAFALPIGPLIKCDGSCLLFCTES